MKENSREHPLPNRPPGIVELVIQRNALASPILPIEVHINGLRLRRVQKHQRIPVPPGPVIIEADAWWLGSYGGATLSFMLESGQTVPVYYAAPMHRGARGAMGHEPQRHEGKVLTIILLTFSLLVLAGAIALMIFG